MSRIVPIPNSAEYELHLSSLEFSELQLNAVAMSRFLGHRKIDWSDFNVWCKDRFGIEMGCHYKVIVDAIRPS